MASRPLPDSSRHGMSWKICRFSAARPEPRFTQEPPGLTPSWRLFRFSASVDHQMTPALFARLFRASRFRLAHWRTGCSRSLWSRSSLAHHAACREGGVYFTSSAGHLARRGASSVGFPTFKASGSVEFLTSPSRQAGREHRAPMPICGHSLASARSLPKLIPRRHACRRTRPEPVRSALALLLSQCA